MTSAFAVFTAWEEEYDRLQQTLRDMMKKKRDDSMKSTVRVSPSHKKLQGRLDQMRRQATNNFMFSGVSDKAQIFCFISSFYIS